MLGNLNGLAHEFKYFEEPGNVTTYTPALPEGARTDDDTDFEWVYIVEMQRRGTVYLSPGEISDLRKQRINRRIWCSNQYVIRAESPRCVAELPSSNEQIAKLRKACSAEVDRGILQSRDTKTRARAAYLAICLDMSGIYQEKHNNRWQEALQALKEHGNIIQAIYYHSNVPAGEALRKRASAAGLEKPATKTRLC